MIQTNEGVKKMKKEVINSPIRWAGSKKKILNEVLTLFDKESEYYVEPFLGSGDARPLGRGPQPDEPGRRHPRRGRVVRLPQGPSR